jgi:hypothetical protein
LKHPGKGCNIGEPNDDFFPENDSEFVRIQKNYGHPWHSDIKQFDLMYIDARNKGGLNFFKLVFQNTLK